MNTKISGTAKRRPSACCHNGLYLKSEHKNLWSSEVARSADRAHSVILDLNLRKGVVPSHVLNGDILPNLKHNSLLLTEPVFVPLYRFVLVLLTLSDFHINELFTF